MGSPFDVVLPGVVLVDVASVGIQGPPGPPGPLGAGTFPDAPTDGTTYGRQSGAWVGVLPLADAPVTVLHFGADPTGVADSTAAFRGALATGSNVFVPAGSYLIRDQLVLGGTPTQAQALLGDGLSTFLLIDALFNPAVTDGVIVIKGGNRNDARPLIEGLVMRFAQPNDLAVLATAASGIGTNTVTVASTAGIVVGMSVIDATTPAAIPAPVLQTASLAATVTGIAGNVVTLSANIASPGVASGDSLQFACVRSMFQPLNGLAPAPGGPGIKYPWAIYCYNATVDPVIRHVMTEYAWNGIYIRGSGFQLDKVDVGAWNIGLDIDQCFNFPSIIDYRFYLWSNQSVNMNPQMALGNVYYDGSTIAANFNRIDGLACQNFQTWAGQVNITSGWSYGQFDNLMLDGSFSNLNVTSANGGGFLQIGNCYTTKSSHSRGAAISVNTSAGFRTIISNLHATVAYANTYGIWLQNGVLIINGGYLWDGLQSTHPMIEADAGSLVLRNMQFDASTSRTDVYMLVGGTLTMQDCAFVAAPGSGAIALRVFTAGYAVSDIAWNGWIFSPQSAAIGQNNNGATFLSPTDQYSMQSGAMSFAVFDTTAHFSTGYGHNALSSVQNGATLNTAFGSVAGYGVSGSANTFMGAAAGFSSAGASGNSNTAIGVNSGRNLTTGGTNTFLGAGVGTDITTGSGNLYLGPGSGFVDGGAAESNTFRVSANAVALMRATAINTAAPALFLDWLVNSTSYANDAAAATGGVGVGQIYRNGSAVNMRVT